jgi:hypothetical protein
VTPRLPCTPGLVTPASISTRDLWDHGTRPCPFNYPGTCPNLRKKECGTLMTRDGPLEAGSTSGNFSRFTSNLQKRADAYTVPSPTFRSLKQQGTSPKGLQRDSRPCCEAASPKDMGLTRSWEDNCTYTYVRNTENGKRIILHPQRHGSSWALVHCPAAWERGRDWVELPSSALPLFASVYASFQDSGARRHPTSSPVQHHAPPSVRNVWANELCSSHCS